MQKIYISVYSNTLLVFKYLCNQVNIRVNRVFVSALILIWQICMFGDFTLAKCHPLL